MLHTPSRRVDVISVILGGENLVKTTVRPSGEKVEAKTSPVETTPGANIVAGPVWRGRPGMMLLLPLPNDAQASDRRETAATGRNGRRDIIVHVELAMQT